MSKYAVIMAGGQSINFWPLSRLKTPKQFQKLDGTDTLLNITIKRVSAVIPIENIFITISNEHREIFYETVSNNFLLSNLIIEPCSMNTAAAIGYSSIIINKVNPNATIGFFPADHYIDESDNFTRALLHSYRLADNFNKIVTIGIRPDEASTAYGYIKCNKSRTMIDEQAYQVESFIEKPNQLEAQSYIEGDGYYWNSGMFVMTLPTVFRNFKTFLPQMYEKLSDLKPILDSEKVKDQLNLIYPTFENISIDYGIMEKSQDLVVYPADLKWCDIRTWTALNYLHKTDSCNNTISGNSISLDTDNSIILGNNKLIATLGISDLIIIDTLDALLICHKDHKDQLGKIIKHLNDSNLNKYL